MPTRGQTSGLHPTPPNGEDYPPLAEKLADLAARVAANDLQIERVNQKLPDGKKWLANAELVARAS